MFCPRCGQERVATETKFCSGCGFLLSGTMELLMTGGVIPSMQPLSAPRESKRRRGIKQGLFIFLLTFLIVPIIAILTIALRIQEPFAVVIAAILLSVGGLLRMAYAAMFESAVSASGETTVGQIPTSTEAAGLPPAAAADFVPPASLFGRGTNDLQPTSVTEGTTRLFDKEHRPQ
jgi:hypothetical protein